jgi:zinc/manganese transport system permease protein
MSIEQIEFLLPAFVMSLILVGIHCYLGLHVLARNVLFVDLALAQVAALGTTIAFGFGFDHHSQEAFFIALGGTFFAALLFTLAGRLKDKISTEAFIGITYAFSSALIILLIDKMSHGAEHLKYTLVGQILWTSWDDVIHVLMIYLGVSFIHYVFRKEFIKSSFNGKNNPVWDFLFFALFGVVITCSVNVSGVLQVFTFLIVPAVISSFFFKTLLSRLLFGWAIGFVLCPIGIYLSLKLDLPPGATEVVTFAILPIILVLIFGVKNLIKGAR